MTYNWFSHELPIGVNWEFKPISECNTTEEYMRYTHCIVSGTKIYWYIIWQGTSKLKFEPIVSWNYKFKVIVSNWNITKDRIIDVNVSK